MYVSERKHNPLVNTAAGGRTLSAMQLPFFLLRPPSGYGVLTTTGRRSGKPRRRCIRAIRREQRAYLVAIKGAQSGWLKNIRANPEVRLRIRGGTFAGVARELVDTAERQEAMEAYCEPSIHSNISSAACGEKGGRRARRSRSCIAAGLSGGFRWPSTSRSRQDRIVSRSASRD